MQIVVRGRICDESDEKLGLNFGGVEQVFRIRS